MDSYYSSSPSYYYQPSCPFHNSYSPYPSHYYPSSSSQIIHYNNSTPNIYAQSSSPTQTTTLNTTFELAPPVGRRRRQRTIFSKEQVDVLDQVFEKNPYPDIQLLEQLSQRLDVPEARIQVWFKNRRSRRSRTNKTKN